MKIVDHNNLNWEAASHEDKQKPGVLKKVMFGANDFDPICGLKMLNFAKIKPGESFKLHQHQTLEEVFYILQGRAVIKVDDEEKEIKSGMAVLIPKKVDHWMKNTGDEDLLYLAFGASDKEGQTIITE